jgi:hypothetical protein
MLSLVALLFAASPSCTASTDGGTVISCGDARVLVSLAPGAPAEALPRVVDSMTKLYAATETKAVEARIGAKKAPGTEVTLFASQKDKTPRGHALVTAVPEKDSKVLSRVLVCTWETGRPLDTCARGFELGVMVSDPQPPAPELPSEQRAWSGVPINAPAGCKLIEPGTVGCKNASLMWGDRPPDGPLHSQKLLADLALRQMPAGSKATEKPCRVGGNKTTCTVLTGLAQGKPFTVIIAIGEVVGRPTSLQCMVGGEVKDAPPSPCDQLVTW